MSCEELWESAFALLQPLVGQVTYDAVLKGLVPKSYDVGSGVLTLVARNRFIVTTATKHIPVIEQCLAEVAQVAVTVALEVSSEIPAPLTVGGAQTLPGLDTRQTTGVVTVQSRGPALEVRGRPLNVRNIFDNFVVADCNRFAHAAAQQVVRNPGISYNPLFIHSRAGLGKTHLMQAIGHQIHAEHPNWEIMHETGEHFVSELVDAIKEHRTKRFVQERRCTRVWLLDDLHFVVSGDKPVSEKELFNTFNDLLNADMQVVTCALEPPCRLGIIDNQLRGRLEMGLLVDLRMPEVEARVEILESKAKLEKVLIPRDILEYLAGKVESDIRTLEGTLLKLCAYQSLHGGSFTPRLVDELVADYTTNSNRPRGMREVVEFVSTKMNVQWNDLIGPKRAKDIAWPRQVAMWLCCKLTDKSLGDIGHFFGGRDHTTVIYARDKVNDLIEADEKGAAFVLGLLAEIKQAP